MREPDQYIAPVVYTPEQVAWILWGRRPTATTAKHVDPNAAMIARDGPAKPIMPAIFFGIDYAAGCAPAPVSTAKPALSGLQREYSSTHLLGSYR